MRKIIKFAVALLIIAAAVPGMAQEWKMKYIKADELKSIEEDTLMFYNTDKWMSTVSLMQDYLCVISKDGIFDSGSMGQSLAKVGVYDSDGNLVEKFNISVTIDSGKTFAYIKNYRARIFAASAPENFRGTQLKEYIINREGSVRILIKRWHDSDLDVRIPCVKSTNIQE